MTLNYRLLACASLLSMFLLIGNAYATNAGGTAGGATAGAGGGVQAGGGTCGGAPQGAPCCQYDGGCEECVTNALGGYDSCTAAGAVDNRMHCCGSVDPNLGSFPILESLGSETTITVDPRAPQATLMNYVNDGLQWLLSVAVGIASLWVIINGITMMMFDDKRREAFDQIMWAVGGLVMLIFIGAILRALNANFFTGPMP